MRRHEPWCCALAVCVAACANQAPAQALHRSAFVANNGNLEGSVSSYRVRADGTLELIEKEVIGSRPNTQVYHPGTNAQTISISPNGRFLAAGHGTSSTTQEQLTILEVAPNGTLSIFAIVQVADSPLCVRWIRDDVFCVTRTTSGQNYVDVFRFDPNGSPPGIVAIDIEPSGSFATWLAVHPSGNFLYSQTTGPSVVFPFRIEVDARLTPLAPLVTPSYPLGLGISPDGTKIYAGGGISAGGHAVCGAFIDGAGGLSAMPGSAFFSPGTSPKQVVISSDNALAFVAHGTDSTVRSFFIDEATGALSATGFSRAVGIQGSLGEIGVLGGLLFVIDRDTINDGVRGLMSFTVQPDGSFPINGAIVDSAGITPYALATWDTACPGDANGDRLVNFADLSLVLANFGASGPVGATPGDVNGDGVVNFADLNIVLANFGAEC